MVGLISTDLVGLVSLVASLLVVLYLIGYSFMLFHSYKNGTIRPDWSISLIFYVGIGLLALGYIVAFTQLVENVFNAAYLIALILFAYGFEKRAGLTASFPSKVATKKRRK